jgi:hypothetical protein
MKTKKVLKTKKALKRLDRVEVLLSKLIDQYPEDELGMRESLDSARTSVRRAKAKAKPGKEKPRVNAKTAARKKAPTKAKIGRPATSGASSTATLDEAIRPDTPGAAAAVSARTA